MQVQEKDCGTLQVPWYSLIPLLREPVPQAAQ